MEGIFSLTTHVHSSVGSIVAVLISVAFTNGYNQAELSQPLSNPDVLFIVTRDIDRAWRILLGLGCLPAVVALYFRLTIPETPRFTMDVERNVKQVRIQRFEVSIYRYQLQHFLNRPLGISITSLALARTSTTRILSSFAS
jgi:hypothetical protein